MVNPTSIFLTNVAMRGILNLILDKGTDPMRLSFLELDIGQKRAAHERMIAELEAEIREDRGKVAHGAKTGRANKARKEGAHSPKKARMSSSHRK